VAHTVMATHLDTRWRPSRFESQQQRSLEALLLWRNRQ